MKVHELLAKLAKCPSDLTIKMNIVLSNGGAGGHVDFVFLADYDDEKIICLSTHKPPYIEIID